MNRRRSPLKDTIKKEWGWAQKSVWIGGAPMESKTAGPSLMSQLEGWFEEDTDESSGCLVASGSVSSACSAEAGRNQADWISPVQISSDGRGSGRCCYKSPLWRDGKEEMVIYDQAQINKSRHDVYVRAWCTT